MSIQVKICGLCDEPGVKAAIEGGASFTGFVFYPPSKNVITPEAAAKLMALVPAGITKTGLFVDPTDEELQKAISIAPIDIIQLHGNESPARVAAIKQLTGKPVMKALRMTKPEHLNAVAAYETTVDRLLFDSRIGNEPSGGPIDWTLLKGRSFKKPWMLAGGLTAQNLAEAVQASGATAVDVSSGVDESPGQKSPAKIRAFLAAAKNLQD